jgi:DMSO/TMAO reductase YedYZ molybdopterin-dependent catalytic subunit
MQQVPLLKVVGDDGSGHQPHPLGEPEAWRLRVVLSREADFTLPELMRWAEASGAASTVEREIHCVSAGGIAGPRGRATFTGVPFAALARHVGLEAGTGATVDPEAGPTVEFVSRAPGTCGPRGRRHRTSLPLAYCLDPEYGVMLVWRLNGEDLPYPNGGPLRSAVGPKLFFYKGIKWLEEIRLHPVRPEALRGTWETYAGYHNLARVEKNERFEPVLLHIAAVTGPAGSEEDELQEVPAAAWVDHFQAAYRQRDLSRLVAAQLHKVVAPFPKDFTGFTFSAGPYRAKIRGTSFASADFTGARMEGVNLSLSKLTNARFSRNGDDPAVLAGGDFEGTYFNKAHLQGVDLRGATLTGATFFADKDFDRPTDRVEGLDVRGARNLDPRTAEWLRRNGALVD